MMKMKSSLLFCWLLICCLVLPCVAAQAEPAPDQRILRVGTPSFHSHLLVPVVEAYQAAHPDIRVDVYIMEEENLRSCLYDQKENFDLYVVCSNKVNHPYLMKCKMILPLESQLVEDDIKTMYPQVQEYVADQGVFYGYPVYLRANYWTVDDALLQQHGLHVPATYLDYLSMMQQWCQQGGNKFGDCAFTSDPSEKEKAYTIDRMLIAYIQHLAARGESITFDTPAFERLLSALHDTLAPYEQISAAEAENSLFAFTGFSPIFDSEPETNHRYILPPTILEGGDASVTAYLDYLVINAATSQKEEAIAFLETYSKFAEPEAELYPYQIALMKDELEKQGASADNVRAFQQQSAHWCLDAAPLIGAMFDQGEPSTIVAQYLADSLSLEQTINALEILRLETMVDLATFGWKTE